jgi:hypothetical protein
VKIVNDVSWLYRISLSGLSCAALLLTAPTARAVDAATAPGGLLTAMTELPDCNDKWTQSKIDGHYNGTENYLAFYNRTARAQCRKDWTVLVFMEGDNDLFPYASWNLWEMEAGFADDQPRAASTNKTDLIVEVEGPQLAATGKTVNSLRRLHMFAQKDTGPSSPWRFSRGKTVDDFAKKTLDDVKSSVVEKIGDKAPLSESERLREFLVWASRKYPSKHYMLVVWGHGDGWGAVAKSIGTSESTKAPKVAQTSTATNSTASVLTSGGLAYRDSTGSWMSIKDLEYALRYFRSVNKKPLDLFVTDACFMQMLEVIDEIAEDADYVVGTTSVEAYQGLPYRSIMNQINTHLFDQLALLYRGKKTATDEPLMVAKMIPWLTQNSYSSLKALTADGSIHQRKGDHYSDDDTFSTIYSSAINTDTLSNKLVPMVHGVEQHIEFYLREFKDYDRIAKVNPQQGLIAKRRYEWRINRLAEVLSKYAPYSEGGSQDFGEFVNNLMLNELLGEEDKVFGSGEGRSTQQDMLIRFLSMVRTDYFDTVVSFVYGDKYGLDPRATSRQTNAVLAIWLPRNRDEYLRRRDEFVTSKFYQDTNWALWLDIVFGVHGAPKL